MLIWVINLITNFLDLTFGHDVKVDYMRDSKEGSQSIDHTLLVGCDTSNKLLLQSGRTKLLARSTNHFIKAKPDSSLCGHESIRQVMQYKYLNLRYRDINSTREMSLFNLKFLTIFSFLIITCFHNKIVPLKMTVYSRHGALK